MRWRERWREKRKEGEERENIEKKDRHILGAGEERERESI